MRHSLIILLVSAMSLVSSLSMAQDRALRNQLPQVGENIRGWDTEINLDTIDQEQLPRKVTGGLLATMNISNFIIRQNGNLFSSYMKVGADLGGLVDFTVTKHFAIQGRLVLTAEQNRFDDTNAANHLWAFGVEIPVLFLARFGNMDKGYLSFGGGPYAHFNYASNIGKKGAEVYSLHDNNSGLEASITYEFPIGIQIMANYMVSITDIISFHKQNATANTVHGIYPQRAELGIAYRWRNSNRTTK